MEAERRISRIFSIILIFSFCYSARAWAESDPQDQNPQIISGKKYAPLFDAWGGAADLNYSRSVIERSDAFYSENLSLGLLLQRKVGNATNLAIGSSFHQELDGFKEKSQGTTTIGLSHTRSVHDTQELNASLALRVYLPTNTESAHHTSFQGATMLGSGLTWRQPDLALGRSLTTALNVSYRENFYTYDATRLGDLNLARMLSSSIGFQFVLNSLWSLDLGAGLTKSYDTKNAALDDVYSHSESIQYQPNKALAFNLGHEIEDVATKYDRVSANVRAYDLAASRVFGAIKFMF